MPSSSTMAARVLLYGGGKQALDLGFAFLIFENHFFVPVHLRN
jgi:hypothetical protein